VTREAAGALAPVSSGALARVSFRRPRAGVLPAPLRERSSRCRV